MTETQNIIELSKRDTGKSAAKAIRRTGLIPGIFYMRTGESFPFSVSPKAVKHIVYTSETKIFNVKFDGDDTTHECIIKDISLDPLTDEILHLDFYGIVRGQKMTVEVPVLIKGTAKGVKEGGLLQQTLRHINVSCLPKHLPSSIEVDITNLSIGDSIYIKDIIQENIEVLIPEDTPIVSVIPPRIVKETETTTEGAAAEIGTEEKEETSGD